MGVYFNKNLKYIRKLRNVSQKELADKIGVDQSTISYWENGMDVTIDNAIKVAEIFDIPIPEFLGKDLTVSILNDDIHDNAIKQLETKTGIKISYASDKELTQEDYIAIKQLVLDEMKAQEEEKK